MARKPDSFKLIEEEKVIVLYENIEPSKIEEHLIDFYLSKGYLPKIETKKKGITVDEMLAELEADKEILAQFEAAYKEKGGFHTATKIYTEWKKAQKEKDDKKN
jgi:hypothetical protein